MKPANKKLTKVILWSTIIVAVFFLVISAASHAKNDFHSAVNNANDRNASAPEDKVDTMIDQAIKAQLQHAAKAKEDIVDEDGNGIGLGTTSGHWQELGISNAQMSSEEEKELYQTVAEAAKAELEYSSDRDVRFLEAVKGLYLPATFDQYEKRMIGNGGFHPSEVKSQSSTDGYLYISDIKAIRFSKPRAYAGLPDRIGVINDVEFNDHDYNSLMQIFIFRKVDGEWKIEEQRATVVRFDMDENNLIKEIKNKKNV